MSKRQPKKQAQGAYVDDDGGPMGAIMDGLVVCVSSFLQLLTSTFGLFCINLAYLLIGAYIFIQIEAPREDTLQNNLQEERDKLVDDLIDLGHGPSAYYEANASEKLAEYEDSLAQFYRKRATVDSATLRNNSEDLKQWTHSGSIIFCYSVITSIGWGNVVPNTLNGRLGTIIYGLFGFPLLFTLSTDVGNVVNRLVFRFWLWTNRFYDKYLSEDRSKRGRYISGDETTSTYTSLSGSQQSKDKSRNRRTTDSEPLLGNDTSNAKESNPYFASALWELLSSSSSLSRTRRNREKENSLTNSSAYLRNIRSSVDFMMYAQDIKNRGGSPLNLPHYRILTKEDALWLSEEFFRMSEEELRKCMEFAGIDNLGETVQPQDEGRKMTSLMDKLEKGNYNALFDSGNKCTVRHEVVASKPVDIQSLGPVKINGTALIMEKLPQDSTPLKDQRGPECHEEVLTPCPFSVTEGPRDICFPEALQDTTSTTDIRTSLTNEKPAAPLRQTRNMVARPDSEQLSKNLTSTPYLADTNRALKRPSTAPVLHTSLCFTETNLSSRTITANAPPNLHDDSVFGQDILKNKPICYELEKIFNEKQDCITGSRVTHLVGDNLMQDQNTSLSEIKDNLRPGRGLKACDLFSPRGAGETFDKAASGDNIEVCSSESQSRAECSPEKYHDNLFQQTLSDEGHYCGFKPYFLSKPKGRKMTKAEGIHNKCRLTKRHLTPNKDSPLALFALTIADECGTSESASTMPFQDQVKVETCLERNVSGQRTLQLTAESMARVLPNKQNMRSRKSSKEATNTYNSLLAASQNDTFETAEFQAGPFKDNLFDVHISRPPNQLQMEMSQINVPPRDKGKSHVSVGTSAGDEKITHRKQCHPCAISSFPAFDDNAYTPARNKLTSSEITEPQEKQQHNSVSGQRCQGSEENRDVHVQCENVVCKTPKSASHTNTDLQPKRSDFLPINPSKCENFMRKPEASSEMVYHEAERLAHIYEEVFHWKEMGFESKDLKPELADYFDDINSRSTRAAGEAEYHSRFDSSVRKARKDVVSPGMPAFLTSQIKRPQASQRHLRVYRPQFTTEHDTRPVDQFLTVVDGLRTTEKTQNFTSTHKAPIILLSSRYYDGDSGKACAEHANTGSVPVTLNNTSSTHSSASKRLNISSNTIQNFRKDQIDVEHSMAETSFQRGKVLCASRHHCSEATSRDFSHADHKLDHGPQILQRMLDETTCEIHTSPESRIHLSSHSGHCGVSRVVRPMLISHCHWGKVAALSQEQTEQMKTFTNNNSLGKNCNAREQTIKRRPTKSESQISIPTAQQAMTLSSITALWSKEAGEKKDRITWGIRDDESDEDYEHLDADEKKVPLLVLYFFIAVFVAIGSLIFWLISEIEGLGFWDSTYFIYVLISTTGFGDILPPDHTFVFIIIYAPVGMAFFNIVINATIELFTFVLDYLNALSTFDEPDA